jgi:hypothetical protein
LNGYSHPADELADLDPFSCISGEALGKLGTTFRLELPAVNELPAAYLKECYDYWYALAYEDTEKKGPRIA